MSSLAHRPPSPVPGLGLEGYVDEWTVHPGDPVRLMLSGAEPGTSARVEIVRLRQADPHPEGPGYRATVVEWGAPATVELARQTTDFGSYVEVSGDAVQALNPPGDFTLALWYRPTRLGGWQTLAAKYRDGDLSYGLFCSGQSAIAAFVSHDGRTCEWISGQGFVGEDLWQFVALVYDGAAGALTVHQLSREPPPKQLEGGTAYYRSERHVGGGPLHPSEAPLLLGAAHAAGGHQAHFNGRLGDPVLLGGALDAEGARALASGAEPSSLAPVLAAWDLSLDVESARVVDVSGRSLHGRAVNAPARAVTGPRWSGVHTALFTDDPASYRAIHLHDDDLEDACWEPTLELVVPETAAFGLYAATIESGDETMSLPFAVTPRRPESELLVLLPTLTWQAYSSNQQAWNNSEDGVLDRGLAVYDRHSDGSPVYYCTRRKPTRSTDPTRGFRLWGAHLHTASLYLLDWLEEKELRYDVVTDEDLDRLGVELLARCRCLVLAGHPEYATYRMMKALKEYTGGGGRIAYLAGNGLYWVTSIDRERPHLIEVRKSGEGDVSPAKAAAPGEQEHSSTLELGGVWARRGLPARSIVGVEFSTTYVPDLGIQVGFERTPESRSERYAFVFEGVESETIGAFGLNMGTASGFEMDCVQEWDWPDGAGPVVLARARHPAFMPLMNAPASPVADIAFLELPGGGAVFAAGAVTWTGSLSHGGYDNDVSRITENVLRRFLDAPAGRSVCG